MSRKIDKEKIRRASENIDTTMLLLMGFGLGTLLAGIIFLIFCVFIDADATQIWSINATISGLICIGISVLMGLITALYWKVIFSKTGVLFPQLHGFSLLFAFVSVLSGAAFAISLAYKFIM